MAVQYLISQFQRTPDRNAGVCKVSSETMNLLKHEQLDKFVLSIDNALKVVEMIHSLIKNQSTLNYNDLSTLLNKLEDIVNISVVTLTLGQDLINIISDILESDSDLLPFTNM